MCTYFISFAISITSSSKNIPFVNNPTFIELSKNILVASIKLCFSTNVSPKKPLNLIVLTFNPVLFKNALFEATTLLAIFIAFFIFISFFKIFKLLFFRITFPTHHLQFILHLDESCHSISNGGNNSLLLNLSKYFSYFLVIRFKLNIICALQSFQFLLLVH